MDQLTIYHHFLDRENMLEQDNKDLTEYITSINQNLSNIFNSLNSLLTRPSVSYNIVFKGQQFFFNPPTTSKEKKIFDKQRALFIKSVLKYVTQQFIHHLPDQNMKPWEMVLSFTYGVDPKDMEFERFEGPIETMQGEIVKQKPLNEESLYVQWQDQSIYPEIK